MHTTPCPAPQRQPKGEISTNPPNSSLLSLRKVYKFVTTEWMYSSDTLPSTLSRGLVLPFWSLKLISAPSHRQSTFELCDLLMSLSRTSGASKLCRWLGGNVQRIKHSLFYTVINSHIMYTFIFLLLKVFKLNLLTRQVHQVSSVGAGSFPIN